MSQMISRELLDQWISELAKEQAEAEWHRYYKEGWISALTAIVIKADDDRWTKYVRLQKAATQVLDLLQTVPHSPCDKVDIEIVRRDLTNALKEAG